MRRPQSSEGGEEMEAAANRQEGAEEAAVRGEAANRSSVVLLVLGFLLAAVIVLYRLETLRTNQSLQRLKEENEALRRNLSGSEEIKQETTTSRPTCPKPLPPLPRPPCPPAPLCPPPPTCPVPRPPCPPRPPSPPCPTCPPPPTCPPRPTCPLPRPPSPPCPTCPPPPTCPPSGPSCPPPPPVNDLTCLKCKPGWEPHGRSCYKINFDRVSWAQSRRSCRVQGGDLVKIDSREEQVFLEGRIRGLMEFDVDRFWIGLTDSAVEGRWLWVDGSPLDESLKFWIDNEPNDSKQRNPAGEDCVRMGVRGGTRDLRCWLDGPCDIQQKSICEKAAEPCFR